MTQEDFKNLFDRYFDPLRGYIYYRSGDQELSTEVAQETFMKIWEKQLMPDPGKEKALLYKIASDLFISRYRRMKVENNYIARLELEFDHHSPEEAMEYNELNDKYEKTIANLPENQRVVFLMSRVEELKYHEIAERLGLSVKAVEKRMSKALAVLKKELMGIAATILFLLLQL